MQNACNIVPKDQWFGLAQVTPDDWLLWRTLRLQALKEAPYAFGSRLADWQGCGDLEERWRERLASVPFNFVAILDDGLVGMVSATALDQNRTVELISMWVAPLARGRGIGDALVGAVVQWARKQGAAVISLDVIDGNLHATELYRRHGFVDAGMLTPTSPVDTPERRFLRKFAVSAQQ